MARHAVVTGASSGIGWAIAARLREHGWDVTGVARRQDRLEALAAETGAEWFVADLTVADDIEALRAHLAERGGVDLLVNNAGGARGLDSVEAGDADDWRWMFEVNVVSVQRTTAALLPLLRRAASEAGWASIVNITSIAATEVYEGGAGYNATKAALLKLTEVLRLELAGEPLRVIEVAPGMVKTEEFSLNRFDGDQERADKVYAGVEHPLTAEDIADVVVYSVELPGHVNLDHITVRPVAQPAQFKVIRGPLRVKGD
ncbi:SDR family oxidoreductase [Herbiconiux sp. L3-i23]|uniref:SDR family oxidoreductase n=1 Tax=Herbiconiux sp. L3-i23 TaxID=2905871 RepID=UPI00204BF43E|nr:SDR family oxidoreductase [Herbiconiux sp. L3-i23]BDI23289.1 oxidoreductase [Herbiconiux sp. L3-i23]